MEEILEELYELLDLYFDIGLSHGLVKGFENCSDVEPQLERHIFRESTLERILELSQRLHRL